MVGFIPMRERPLEERLCNALTRVSRLEMALESIVQLHGNSDQQISNAKRIASEAFKPYHAREVRSE